MVYYVFDTFGRYSGESDIKINNSTNIPPKILSSDYNWTGDIWVYAPNIKTAPTVASQVLGIKVSPVVFKLLWSIEERISLEACRSEDPILDNFFTLIEDVKLTEVDLSLSSTRYGVEYAVNALITHKVISEIDKDKRILEVLSGVII